jgi:hypothetical protein
MGKVIRFPNALPIFNKPIPVKTKNLSLGGGTKIFLMMLKFVWALHVLLWPFSKWVLALDVVFQFSRMLYYFEDRGFAAGTDFGVHFVALVVLTYFANTNVFKK